MEQRREQQQRMDDLARARKDDPAENTATVASDVEMTRLCAGAMGWHTGAQAGKVVSYSVADCAIIVGNDRGGESVYDPLHNDAQAMMLVKRLKLSVGFNHGWGCVKNDDRGLLLSGAYHHDSLNRAVVVCVAMMRAATELEFSAGCSDSTEAK